MFITMEAAGRCAGRQTPLLHRDNAFLGQIVVWACHRHIMEALFRDTQPSGFLFGHMTLIATAFTGYFIFTWLYNIYFHPLTGLPGRRLLLLPGYTSSTMM
ncbi:hypothetical protein F4801DRAFT_223477 [Xylaria longipes]|nr:hypothetical protein F4801DRAFT_223477 [Xylaria longipes]